MKGMIDFVRFYGLKIEASFGIYIIRYIYLTFFIFPSFVPFEFRRRASAYRAHIRADIYCHILYACQYVSTGRGYVFLNDRSMVRRNGPSFSISLL